MVNLSKALLSYTHTKSYFATFLCFLNVAGKSVTFLSIGKPNWWEENQTYIAHKTHVEIKQVLVEQQLTTLDRHPVLTAQEFISYIKHRHSSSFMPSLSNMYYLQKYYL